MPVDEFEMREYVFYMSYFNRLRDVIQVRIIFT